MIEEAEELHRRVAYLDTVRGLHRRERLIGLVGCLVGVVLLVIGRFRPGAPVWLTWAGLAVVVASWTLFAFVIYRRTRYVRDHPYSASTSPES